MNTCARYLQRSSFGTGEGRQTVGCLANPCSLFPGEFGLADSHLFFFRHLFQESKIASKVELNSAQVSLMVFCCGEQFVCILTIMYLCLCAYYTTFKVRIFSYYYLVRNHLTDENSLIFCGM